MTMQPWLILSLMLGTPALMAAEAPHAAAPMLADPQALQQQAAAGEQQAVAGFRQAYAKAGRPRMAIYFNRQLSAEIEEWKTPVRIETTVANRYGEVMQAQTAVHLRTATPDDDPGNSLDWAFEEGFYNAFANASARLVDRRMLLRLAAARRPENATALVAARHVEMDGLAQHADLLVELLIERRPGTPSGYTFKAQATSVRSAQVVALVNAHDLEPTKGRYVAGANGYQRASASSDPEYVASLGAQLATRLMASLGRGLQ